MIPRSMMFNSVMLRSGLAGLALALASAPASAATLIVDANGGPGSQFTDIGAAIAAAQPGDVILVRQGTYAPFVASKGVTILGQGIVIVNGQAALVGVPAFERSALLGVRAQTLVVDSCDGPVLLQDLRVDGNVRFISTPDARLRNVEAFPQPGLQSHALTVESSRVEIVASHLVGSNGLGGTESGGSGLVAFSAGRLFVVDSMMRGGNGENSQVFGTFAGGGGFGVHLLNTSELRIVGGSSAGGYGGICWAQQCNSDCSYDGSPGYGVACAPGTTAHYSASTVVTSASFYYGIHCVLLQPGPFGGNGHVLVAPDDPMLSTTGTPTAGQSVTFTVSGPAGNPATLWIGRGLTVQPTPGVAVEILVPQARVFALGPIPPSGTISRTFTIPAGLPTGFALAAQAEVTLQSGEVRRTNSAPIVVR